MRNTNPLDCLSRGIWRSFHCGEAEDIYTTHFQLLYASWHTLVSAVFANLLNQRSRPGNLDYQNLPTWPSPKKNASAYPTATVVCSTKHAKWVSPILCSPTEKQHCVNVKRSVPVLKIFTIPQLRKTYFINHRCFLNSAESVSIILTYSLPRYLLLG
jgi:hypothetical protein